MPVYSFRDKKTGEEFKSNMSYDDMVDFVKINTENYEQIMVFPALHSGRGMGKIDNSFRDVLKEIKKNNSRGLKSSTVNVEGN